MVSEFHILNFTRSPAIRICYIKIITSHAGIPTVASSSIPSMALHVGTVLGEEITGTPYSQSYRLWWELNHMLDSWSVMLRIEYVKLTWPMNTEWAKYAQKICKHKHWMNRLDPLTRLFGLSLHSGKYCCWMLITSGGDYYSDQCFFRVQSAEARVSFKLC